ncbi:YidB family protein [Aquitalea sp. ASV15]|uniref:YidB family protein n=1 Tax=Aquitalea sp. ASV15 TaxID=2795104 RepID=UPI0018EBCED9|nr:YidB family protein [Aquitalea sp. ASV15]
MSLFDQLGGLLGGEGGGVAGAVSELMQQQGGLAGLVEKFNSGGMSELVSSWVGTGGNLPVSAEQIQQVLGNEQVAALAGKFGLDPQQLSQALADYLPQAVDKLTPDGQVPQGGDLLSQGLGMLQGFFNKS